MYIVFIVTCPFCTNLSASRSEEQVVKYIKALQKKTIPLSENDESKLKWVKKFHEIGKGVGYTTVQVTLNDDENASANGTVFHCGGSWLYTCSHVVNIVDQVNMQDTFVLDSQKITFKWIDLDSETTKLHEFTPPPPPCGRIGIFTKITNDDGKIDPAKIDLATFREDRIACLNLPSILFKSIVDMEFKVTYEDEIPPHLTDEVLDSESESESEEFWRKKNETTFVPVEYLPDDSEPDDSETSDEEFLRKKNETTIVPRLKLEEEVTSKDVTSSSGDTLYHIYWDFSGAPKKMFYFTERIGNKVTVPHFEFDSPAPEGASGSPLMVYRKVHGPEKEFCLVGVMSGGEKYIQVAELPESIKDHSMLTTRINSQHNHLIQYTKLSETLDDKELIKTTLKRKEEIKKTIRDILQEKGLEIFLGSLCIDIAEPMHDMAA